MLGGDKETTQLNVPRLSHPTQVAVGNGFACALDDSGVKCWSDNFGWNQFLSDVPPLAHPRQISAGAYAACALDDSGVQCWGETRNQYGPWGPPPLVHPRQVSVGGNAACALDDAGIKCWALATNGVEGPSHFLDTVPVFSHPRQISVADNFYRTYACGLDDSGVKCWGNNETGQLNVPPLSHPRSISTGLGGACALDDSGWKCWGEYFQGGPPQGFLPGEVAAGLFYACGLAKTGAKCWGGDVAALREALRKLSQLRIHQTLRGPLREGAPITYTFYNPGGSVFSFDNYYSSARTYERAFREVPRFSMASHFGIGRRSEARATRLLGRLSQGSADPRIRGLQMSQRPSSTGSNPKTFLADARLQNWRGLFEIP